MERENKDLFNGIDLDNIVNSEPNEKNTVDSSIFEKEPEKQKDDETTSEKEDVKKDDTKKESSDKDNKSEKENKESTIDSSFFEKEIESTTNPEDSPSSENSSLLQSFVSTLKDEGLISLEDEENISSLEELKDKFRETIINREFEDLTETQKNYVEALRNGIPEEEIKQNFSNIKALNNITEDKLSNEENEGLRKILIMQDFIAKGISQSKAEKLANRSIELGDDFDDAKEALISLKTIEEKKLEIANKKFEEEGKLKAKEEEKKLSQLKEKVLKKETFGPSIKINSTTKEKIFNNATKIIDYDKNGNGITALQKAAMEDPENFTIMQSFIYTITNGFKDWGKFKNVAKTNAIKTLDAKLNNNKAGAGNSGARQPLSTSANDLLKALDRY